MVLKTRHRSRFGSFACAKPHSLFTNTTYDARSTTSPVPSNLMIHYSQIFSKNRNPFSTEPLWILVIFSLFCVCVDLANRDSSFFDLDLQRSFVFKMDANRDDGTDGRQTQTRASEGARETECSHRTGSARLCA